MSEHWTLGILLGLPLWSLLTLVLLGGAVLAFIRDDGYNGPIIALLGGFGIISLLGMAVGFYPYGAQYHKWQPVHGTVDTVSSRFLGDGKSTTQRFVVVFADGRTRSCDDTRCALVKPGDTLGLYCKRAFQWAATPGWDCNYVERNGSDQ